MELQDYSNTPRLWYIWNDANSDHKNPDDFDKILQPKVELGNIIDIIGPDDNVYS